MHEPPTGQPGRPDCFVARLLNNKSDGYFDSILPNTTLRYEFYDSKEDIQTVADLANTIRKNAFGGRGPDIILGAGTSACTMALHSILKHFEILQVSPASTSGFLSVSGDQFFYQIYFSQNIFNLMNVDGP